MTASWRRMLTRAVRLPSLLDAAAAVLFCILALIVAWGLSFGPVVWTSSPAMVNARALGISFPVWSIVWAVYGLALLPTGTRKWAFAVGFLPWGFFLFAAAEAAWKGQLTSIIGAASLTGCVVLQPICARWSQIVEEWRPRR